MKEKYTPPIVETVDFCANEPMADKTSLNFSDFFPKSVDNNEKKDLFLKEDNSNT